MMIDVDLDSSNKYSLDDLYTALSIIKEFGQLNISLPSIDVNFERLDNKKWQIRCNNDESDCSETDKKLYTTEEVKNIITTIYNKGDWRKLCNLKEDPPIDEKADHKWDEIEMELNSPKDLDHFRSTMNRALKLVSEHEFLEEFGHYVYMRAGEVFMEYGDYKKALEFFNKYVELASKNYEGIEHDVEKEIKICKKKIEEMEENN